MQVSIQAPLGGEDRLGKGNTPIPRDSESSEGDFSEIVALDAFSIEGSPQASSSAMDQGQSIIGSAYPNARGGATSAYPTYADSDQTLFELADRVAPRPGTAEPGKLIPMEAATEGPEAPTDMRDVLAKSTLSGDNEAPVAGGMGVRSDSEVALVGKQAIAGGSSEERSVVSKDTGRSIDMDIRQMSRSNPRGSGQSFDPSTGQRLSEPSASAADQQTENAPILSAQSEAAEELRPKPAAGQQGTANANEAEVPKDNSQQTAIEGGRRFGRQDTEGMSVPSVAGPKALEVKSFNTMPNSSNIRQASGELAIGPGSRLIERKDADPELPILNKAPPPVKLSPVMNRGSSPVLPAAQVFPFAFDKTLDPVLGTLTETVPIDLEESVKLATADRARPEPIAARSIVNQVIHSVSRTPGDAVIEVRLQPEELGRVRLSMTPAEAGLAVQVTAERPETLDLLRRNIDALEQELKQNGFEEMSFSFGSDTSGASAHSGEGASGLSLYQHQIEPSDERSADTDEMPTAGVSENGRVDIRI